MNFTLPKYEQKNYEISKEKALHVITKKNIYELVKSTGSRLVDERSLIFYFFDFQIKFDLNKLELTIPDSIKTKSTEGLILHYIAYSKGIQPSGNWIQFYQIKDATLYQPVFKKRTIDIINKAVKTPEQFFAKALKLGGKEIDFISSARAFKFSAFPFFPILLVYYEGDDEIPWELKFLFDQNCISNLPPEDIVITSQFISLQFFKV